MIAAEAAFAEIRLPGWIAAVPKIPKTLGVSCCLSRAASKSLLRLPHEKTRFTPLTFGKPKSSIYTCPSGVASSAMLLQASGKAALSKRCAASNLGRQSKSSGKITGWQARIQVNLQAPAHL